MHPQTHFMMKLFEGYMGAHGVYNIPSDAVPDDNGKIKGKAATKKSPVTVELWHAHLMGEQGLGIIPINEKSEVKFGAIDIDEYSGVIEDINRQVQEHNLPLLVCRSKSGGTHLFLLMKEFIPAKLMYAKLKEIAAFLGYGKAEVFPKQTQLLVERGDIGQWINMPYFSAADTDRYCVDAENKKIPIDKFVFYASNREITKEELVAIKMNQERLSGGPPCLQALLAKGFPPGTRNNGLFALGVYAQKSNPDSWEGELDKLNTTYMVPPLAPKEVLGVITSLKKKEYNYPCQSEPLRTYCDVNKCRMCKFGVGGLTGMPVMGTLTKLATNPPLWFLEIMGGSRIELSTEELQNPLKFQRRCMEVLNVVPPVLKRDVWEVKLTELLQNVQVIEVPDEASPAGMLLEHIKTFCTGSVQAKNMDELLLGKPYTSTESHYFRLKDLIAYLKRLKFDDIKQNRITAVIKHYGGEHGFSNLKGVGTNWWKIPIFKNRQLDPFDIPDVGKGNPL